MTHVANKQERREGHGRAKKDRRGEPLGEGAKWKSAKVRKSGEGKKKARDREGGAACHPLSVEEPNLKTERRPRCTKEERRRKVGLQRKDGAVNADRNERRNHTYTQGARRGMKNWQHGKESKSGATWQMGRVMASWKDKRKRVKQSKNRTKKGGRRLIVSGVTKAKKLKRGIQEGRSGRNE